MLNQFPVEGNGEHFQMSKSMNMDCWCARDFYFRPGPLPDHIAVSIWYTPDFLNNCALSVICGYIFKFCSPWQVVQRMVTEILTVPGVSRVLYDLTAKPPGTTEWEWCCALSTIAFYTKLCVMLVGCECGASIVIRSRTSALLVLCETSQASISHYAWGLALWIICNKLHFFNEKAQLDELYYIF